MEICRNVTVGGVALEYMENLMSRTWTLLHCAAVLASTALMACAYDVETMEEGEPVADSKEAVIGGSPASEAKYGAVGALVISLPEFEYYDVFCSATLIDDKAIVTARHCMPMVQDALDYGSGAFVAFGPDAFNPTQMIPIEGYVTAPPSPTGGLLDAEGRDVAVAYLSARPKNIKPAKVGRWENKMLGDKFQIVGYGYSSTGGSYGQKFVGTGTARAIKGYWYPLLFNNKKQKFLDWYYTDAATSPTPEQAEQWWSTFKLETDYELLATGLPGEAVGCNGDSGGPIVKGSNANNLTTYGVSFAVEGQFSTICGKGAGYAVFNKTMEKFVEGAIKKPCRGGHGHGNGGFHGHGNGHGHGH